MRYVVVVVLVFRTHQHEVSYFCSVFRLASIVARYCSYLLVVQQTCYQQVNGRYVRLEDINRLFAFRPIRFHLDDTDRLHSSCLCNNFRDCTAARMDGCHHHCYTTFLINYCSSIEGFLFQLLCTCTFSLLVLPFIVSTCTYAFFKYL